MKKKILVIHQGALGDLVLIFPALMSLKHEEKASVALLCTNGLGKIAHELNVVNEHFSLERARFYCLFSEEMTPVVKEFINDYDTVVLISFSDVIERHIRQNHRGKVHRISPRPPVEEETHVTLHLIRQLQRKRLLKNTCGFEPQKRVHSPSASGPPKADRELQSLRSKPLSITSNMDGSLLRKERFVVIHPGAGSQKKRWPLKNFIQVAAAIRGMNLGEVVFIIGPAESDLAPFIKARTKEGFRVDEVYDLSYVTALLRQARCFIGHDSGVTHLAAFMGTPTVAIFGPSSPKRWAPVGHAVKVLRGEADCAPCFELGVVDCKDRQCLDGVSADMVLDAVRELVHLGGNRGCDGGFR